MLLKSFLLFLTLPITMTTPSLVSPSTSTVEMFYHQSAKAYGIAWSWLAALDMYSKTTAKRTRHISSQSSLPKGFTLSPYAWQGIANPIQNDHDPKTIALFSGYGKDVDKDGLANPASEADRIASLAHWLRHQGTSNTGVRRVLWDYYQDDLIVERITGFESVIHHFNRISLTERAFPVIKRASYSYRDTWGDGRSFGGRRMHEGTDIFAPYGTPVLSACYGYVDLIGWNRLGGWRIGLRSVDNHYFYYAHLSSFAKGIRAKTIVQPGQVIGYVGSSGYGRPGTSGKFPPHLHFGIYHDTGVHEWAFDPYPSLKRWEKKRQIVYEPSWRQPKRPVT
nr:M23 family metallopeptidase [Bacilli bacterium]